MHKYSCFVIGRGLLADIEFPVEMHKGDRFIYCDNWYEVNERQIHLDLKSPETPPVTLFLIKKNQ